MSCLFLLKEKVTPQQVFHIQSNHHTPSMDIIYCEGLKGLFLCIYFKSVSGLLYNAPNYCNRTAFSLISSSPPVDKSQYCNSNQYNYNNDPGSNSTTISVFSTLRSTGSFLCCSIIFVCYHCSSINFWGEREEVSQES